MQRKIILIVQAMKERSYEKATTLLAQEQANALINTLRRHIEKLNRLDQSASEVAPNFHSEEGQKHAS